MGSVELSFSLFVAALGMGVVVAFLVLLSALMVGLKRLFDRTPGTPRTSASAPSTDDVGSPGWIAATTAAWLATRGRSVGSISATAWRPFETEASLRWVFGQRWRTR